MVTQQVTFVRCHLERNRLNKPLFMDRHSAEEALKVENLIRGVLINDEDIVRCPVHCKYEAEIELPNNAHMRFEVLLVEVKVKICLSDAPTINRES